MAVRTLTFPLSSSAKERLEQTRIYFSHTENKTNHGSDVRSPTHLLLIVSLRKEGTEVDELGEKEATEEQRQHDEDDHPNHNVQPLAGTRSNDSNSWGSDCSSRKFCRIQFTWDKNRSSR